MKVRTPQEKKQLSYERDRRNTYGEAPHASRKAIPLRKALRSRSNRRRGNQILQASNPVTDSATAELIESNLQHRKLNDWGKSPDEPLGKVVKEKLRKRSIMREGGGRSALMQSAKFGPPDSEDYS
jgi:hypothetical protein